MRSGRDSGRSLTEGESRNNMLTVLAPAKINLTLEVLGKRPDGYHEIRSIMQAINLFDSLKFQLNDDISFHSDIPGWIPEKSLVYMAARLLKETTGCSKGADIEVEKRIPLVSGLGGDSSDASATLRGLNELWELNLPPQKILELAAQLGSDVSFFLYGGTALVVGRGEVVTPLSPLSPMWVVLVVPDVPRLPDKTKQLYASFKTAHYTDGRIMQKVAEDIKKGKEPSILINSFENVAFTKYSGLKVYRDHFLKMGAENVYLAGSGPALFTLLKDKTKAENLYERCKNQGMEVYLVGTEIR